jgi:uncharacterized protein (TIGR02596 family)
MKNSSPARGSHAFSMVELIVVISIIVIIAAFTIPAASTMLRGSQLTQASQIMVDQMSLARQIALGKNRSVEVRFYRYGDPEIPGEDKNDPSTGDFRAIQLFEVLESGATVPLNKFQPLPPTVIMSPEDLSSLIDENVMGKPKNATKDDDSAPELPRGIGRKYEWVSFRFLQDGSTNLKQTSSWFVTLHRARRSPDEKFTKQSLDKDVPNFFTLQIDPVSGTTKSFRPTAA